MLDIINKLKDLIQINTKPIMTSEQEQYVAGLSDALKLIESSSVVDNLIIGNRYFVIMYQNGDINMPYVAEMKLYKIAIGRAKNSYCFTFNLDGNKHSGTPDLVLASRKGILNRVFYTKEQAEKYI